MRIDAHQHFWRPARGDYGWLTRDAHPAICRDFGPEDLAPLLREAGIEKSVLVQAAPSEAETRFLLEIARTTPFVAGVVGWTDLAAADAPARVFAMAQDPKLLGLRPMLQDLDDDAWILRPELAPALDAMQETGLTLDALVKPRHLAHLARLISDRPALAVVIDHGAKPAIATGDLAAWARDIRSIAATSRTFCKLSGLPNEAASGWRDVDLRSAADVLLDAFGAGRLMWGSNWPVVDEAGGYAVWRSATNSLLAGCAREERDLIFGGAAAAFYGIAA